MPLEVVRHILNLAASEWLDEYGMTWLQTVPKIRLLPRSDAREPYPLQWEEQTRLFNALPPHLLPMCLFAVNTGLRDSEVCGLKWEWEQEIPELDTSIFIIPKEHVKNGEDRLVVLNRISQEIIRQQRGINPVWVFTYQGHPIQRITNTGWKNARASVGLSHVHEHDLKHTFGRRLRAEGVSFEDRQDLLGHKSDRITTHYSAPEIANLIDAANKVCAEESRKSPAQTILRKKIPLRLVSNRAG
jgi:integrase